MHERTPSQGLLTQTWKNLLFLLNEHLFQLVENVKYRTWINSTCLHSPCSFGCRWTFPSNLLPSFRSQLSWYDNRGTFSAFLFSGVYLILSDSTCSILSTVERGKRIEVIVLWLYTFYLIRKITETYQRFAVLCGRGLSCGKKFHGPQMQSGATLWTNL